MLNGTLDAFSATEILALLERSGATGALHIKADEDRVIFCADGAVTLACIDDASGAGDLFVRAGFLTSDELGTVGNDAALLAALLERRGVDGNRLTGFLRHQTEESVFEVGEWIVGDFAFEPDRSHPLGEVFRYPIADLLSAVKTRREAWEPLLAKLGSVDLVADLLPGLPGDEGQVAMSRAQFRVVSAIDGTRSLRDLAFALGDGLFHTCQLVAGLVDSGLVRVGEARIVDLTETRSARQAANAANDPRASALEAALSGSTSNGNGNGNGNGAKRPAKAGGVAVADVPRPPRKKAADDEVPDLPDLSFTAGGGKPDRGLVLRLLSAVKELDVTQGRAQ